MTYVYAHTCPIAAPIYGPYMPPYMAIYTRMHTPLSGTKIRTIKKVVKKRQALCLIWTSLLVLAIYSPYIRAGIGHIWEQQWGMYTRIHSHVWGHIWAIYEGIHGPHGSSNGVCMRAYMGHIWGHTWATWEQQWGMHARIHGHIWGHTWATREQQWGMHARIHGPYIGAYMGHMGAAIGHACAHIWPYMGAAL